MNISWVDAILPAFASERGRGHREIEHPVRLTGPKTGTKAPKGKADSNHDTVSSTPYRSSMKSFLVQNGCS